MLGCMCVCLSLFSCETMNVCRGGVQGSETRREKRPDSYLVYSKTILYSYARFIYINMYPHVEMLIKFCQIYI